MTGMDQRITKDSWLYAGILLTWALCLVHFNPKFLSLLGAADSLFAKANCVVFVLFLNLFWLYGIFHCFFFLYRLFPPKYALPEKKTTFRPPKVALLYTTRNDFQERAARSCLEQSHPNFHLYLLDDSTEGGYKARVDEFQELRPEKITIVRRSDRKGFKAGNLNNALRNHATDCDYFGIIDADEVIPPDFIEKLMPYFSLHEKIAFVQANHKQNPVQPSKFAQDLALGIDFHWDVYQPPRNNCGFVIFYGHGALIRRDMWNLAGGFPEIVSEDLAFATRIRQLGYRGHFAQEVTCYEDFPETYQQFRKRYEKWVKGACEYLHHEFRPFFLSKRVTFPEKLDVLFSCFSLFIPALFLVYLFVASAVLPTLLAEEHTSYATIFGHRFKLIPAYFMKPSFEKLWTFDFYLITLIGVFSPIFCYVSKIISQPKQITRLLFKSAVPYISLILVSACGVLAYLFTKKAVFLTTGDKTEDALLLPQCGNGLFWDRLNSNHPLVYHMEWLLGLLFTYFAFKTSNFALLTISSCLVLSPLIARYGWDSKVLSFLVLLPLAFVLLAFSSMGMGFLGIQGLLFCFLSLHF